MGNFFGFGDRGAHGLQINDMPRAFSTTAEQTSKVFRTVFWNLVCTQFGDPELERM